MSRISSFVNSSKGGRVDTFTLRAIVSRILLDRLSGMGRSQRLKANRLLTVPEGSRFIHSNYLTYPMSGFYPAVFHGGVATILGIIAAGVAEYLIDNKKARTALTFTGPTIGTLQEIDYAIRDGTLS